jgi:hypothetical protein
MALGSIERYLLVFHHIFLARYRPFLSTIPMIICIVYPTVWYVTVTFTSWWCTYKPNYSTVECGLPCYLTNSAFYLAFIICAQHLLPIFITTVANVSLIIGVLHRRGKMKRNNSWQKNLRMTTQLLSVAFLYVVVWLPHCILSAFPLFTKGNAKVIASSLSTEYFINIMSIYVCLYPFIALVGLSHLHDKIKQSINVIRAFCLPCCNKRPNLVSPTITRNTQ